MEIQSAFNAGVQGFQRATEQASQAASDIQQSLSAPESQESNGQEQQESAQVAATEVNEPTPSLTDSVVQLKVSEFQAKASANVIQSADDALGSLVDIKV